MQTYFKPSLFLNIKLGRKYSTGSLSIFPIFAFVIVCIWPSSDRRRIPVSLLINNYPSSVRTYARLSCPPQPELCTSHVISPQGQRSHPRCLLPVFPSFSSASPCPSIVPGFKIGQRSVRSTLPHHPYSWTLELQQRMLGLLWTGQKWPKSKELVGCLESI